MNLEVGADHHRTKVYFPSNIMHHGSVRSLINFMCINNHFTERKCISSRPVSLTKNTLVLNIFMHCITTFFNFKSYWKIFNNFHTWMYRISIDHKMRERGLTWYVLSKLSYMNLVIRDVLPTEMTQYIHKINR